MSVAISGGFVIVTLLVVSLLAFGTFLTVSTTQGSSLRDASKSRTDQVAGSISISSTTTGDVVGGTLVTAVVDNPGAISYGTFSDLDLVVEYTNTTGDQETRRLDYVCRQLCGDSTDPGNNEWTVSNISPGSYNPKMWDPDETASISMKVVPKVKGGSSGTVVVVVPGGVSDSAYFNN